MNRPRKLENQGLPEYVFVEKGKQRKDGSWPEPYYVYRPPGIPQIPLGHTKAQMYREYLKLTETPMRVNDTADLIERYVREESSGKPEESYKLELIKANFTITYFKGIFPHEVTPQHIYEYMDIRSKKVKTTEIINGRKVVITRGGKVAANREASFLSRVFSFGIRKGVLITNPCSEIEKFQEKPRDRYPEDGEFKAVYDEGSEILKCIMDFEYLTGQRIGDARNITESDISNDGIKIIQDKSLHTKQKVKLLIEWSDALKECVNRARRLRGTVRSIFLFCKKDGQPYTADGIRSMFDRAMQKALDKGTLKEKFHLHDIRAKTYSDDDDQDQKIKRAGHVNAKMGRVYDRKFKKVKPLK